MKKIVMILIGALAVMALNAQQPSELQGISDAVKSKKTEIEKRKSKDVIQTQQALQEKQSLRERQSAPMQPAPMQPVSLRTSDEQPLQKQAPAKATALKRQPQKEKIAGLQKTDIETTDAYRVAAPEGNQSNDSPPPQKAPANVTPPLSDPPPPMTLFGYRLYPTSGKGIVSFPIATPGNVSSLSTYTPDNRVGSGEYLNKYLYLATYQGEHNLVQLSTDDWSVVTTKPLSLTQQIGDMTYDYTTNTMYGILLSPVNGLYTIDLETASLTLAAPLSINFITLACHRNGTLYGISEDGDLYTINKTNGATTLVGNTGKTPRYLQSMCFDHTTGKLYWAFLYALDVSDGGLYEVSLTDGAATFLGLIGSNGTEVVALHMPYIDNPDVPDMPTGFTATPDAGGLLSCELSWTNPNKTADGRALTDLTSVTVTRDGVVIYSQPSPAIGAPANYTDNSPTNGWHTYGVYGINSAGDGYVAYQTIYAGIDSCALLRTLPFTENFETATFPPSCWTVYDATDRDAIGWLPGTANNYRGTQSAYHTYIARIPTPDDWLISPAITLPPSGTYTLTFWSFIGWADYYGKNSVLVSTGSANPADGNFVEVWSPTSVANGWTEEAPIDLTPYGGQTIYIAFQYEGYDAHEWAVDDIAITALYETDATVISIDSPETVVSGLTNSETVTATIKNVGVADLTSSGQARLYIDGVWVANTSVGPLATDATVSVSFVNISGLENPGSSYTLAVSIHYPGDENPTNDSIIKQIYHCGVFNTPITEGFEGTLSPPLCWTAIDQSPSGNTPGVFASTSITRVRTGSRSWMFSSYYGLPTDSYSQYLISPELMPGAARELKFYYRSYPLAGETFRVGYSISTADVDNAFTWEAETTATENEWKEYRLYIPADVKYIAIHYTSVYMYWMHIDDLTIMQIPANDLKILPVFPTDYPQVPASQFVLSAKAENRGLDAQTNVVFNATLNGTPFGPSATTVPSLAAGSVSSELTITVPPASVPIGPVTAVYSISATETEDRPDDNSATLTFTGTNSVYAYDNITSFTAGIGSGSGPISLGNVFPIHSPATLSQIAIGFASGTALGYSISLYKMTNDVTVDAIPLFTQPVTRNSSGLNVITVPPTPLDAGTRYFVCVNQLTSTNILVSYETVSSKLVYVKLSGNNVLSTVNTGYAVAIRMVLESAVCSSPASLTASVTAYSGTFSWSGTAPRYIVTVDDGVRAATYTALNTSIVIPLMDGTTYNWSVKALCDATNVSAEATGTPVTTPNCNVTLPLTEGLNAATLPNCWRAINLGATNNAPVLSATILPSPCEGTRYYRFSSYNAAAVYDQYLITPHLINATAGEITVRFQYRIQSASYPEAFRVGYSTTDGDINSFTWVDDITATSTSCQQYEKQIPCNAKFVAIHYYSYSGAYNRYLYVDNFNITAATPTVPDVALTDLVINTSGALTANEPVTVTVQNKGIAATDISVTCSVNCTQTQTIAALAPCETATLTFYFDMSLPILYNIEAYVGLAGDTDSGNDTARTNVGTNTWITGHLYTVAYWDFEDGQIPAGFAIYNEDGATPVEPIFADAWIPYYDFFFDRNVVASTSWFDPMVTADRWLVTPAILLPPGAKLSWLGAAFYPDYPDGYEVRLSTTDTDPADFTTLLFTISSENELYTYREIDLSAYEGQTVHIAFRQNSLDGTWIMIDDIKVEGIGISACSQNPFIYNLPSFTGVDVSWSRAAHPAINGGAAGAGTGTVDETLTNSTAEVVEVTYTVTFTLNGCGSPETFTVAVQPHLSLNSPDVDTICSHELFTYTPTTAVPGASLSWERLPATGIIDNNNQTSTSGIGFIAETLINTLNVPVTVTYHCIITYGNCSSTQDVRVVVNPRPTKPNVWIVNGNATFCAGDSITLIAEVLNADRYTWLIDGTNTGVTTGQYTTSAVLAVGAHTITVSANSTDACTSEATTIIVTVNNIPTTPALTPAGDLVFCEGTAGSVTLTAGTVTGAVTYEWYKNGIWLEGVSGTTYFTSESGTYSVRAVNAVGCASPLAVPVTVVTLPLPTTPTVTLSGALEFCEGESALLQANAIDAATYTWYRNGGVLADQTASLIEVTESGSYSVEVVSSNNCPAPPLRSETIVITVNAKPAQPSITFSPAGNVICEGDSRTLQITPVTGATYRWYKDGVAVLNSTSASLLITEAGFYQAEVVSDKGCISPISTPVELIVNPIPATPVITGDAIACEGEPIVLTAESAGASTYVWYRNGNIEVQRGISRTYEVNTDVTVNTSDTYTVKTISASGCSSTVSAGKAVDIEAYPDTPVIEGDPLIRETRGSSHTFYVLTPHGALEYQWFHAPKQTPEHRASAPVELWDGQGATLTRTNIQLSDAGEYYVIAITPKAGCFTKSAPVELLVEDEIKASNIITANGDGQNDRWIIEGLDTYKSNELQIVNRYGNEVYRTSNYPTTEDEQKRTGWDGTNLPDGVYFYSIALTDKDDTVIKRTGYVTLKH